MRTDDRCAFLVIARERKHTGDSFLLVDLLLVDVSLWTLVLGLAGCKLLKALLVFLMVRRGVLSAAREVVTEVLSSISSPAKQNSQSETLILNNKYG